MNEPDTLKAKPFVSCRFSQRIGERIINPLSCWGAFVVLGLLLAGCTGPRTVRPVRPLRNSIGMRFVPLPGTNMLISIWETRVQDFEIFTKARGYDAEKDVYSITAYGWRHTGASWRNPGFSQSPDHPVCGVSWRDAKAFCKWLTDTERKAGLLAIDQEYRLPTDSEWSLAVGLKEDPDQTPGGKDANIPVFFPGSSPPLPLDRNSIFKSTSADIFPWGTIWPPPKGAGNYAGEEADEGDWPATWSTIGGYRDKYARTAPVGSFLPNRLGIFDLGGNVAEWCEDMYDRATAQGVLRGGSYLSNLPNYLLSADRVAGPQGSRYLDRGFRCVLVAKAR